METIILILAIALIAVGAYGAWPLIKGDTAGNQRQPRVRSNSVVIDRSAGIEKNVLESLQRQVRDAAASLAQNTKKPAPAASFATAPAANLPAASVLFNEVDSLKSQVEQLRSEVGALSSHDRIPDRQSRQRPSASRYRIGVYSSLPPILRQQVQATRHTRLHV
jgi:hypothetical protein